MSFHNLTFAMDLSLSSPGFAALATTDEGELIMLEVSHVKTDEKQTHGFRLSQIKDEIDRYLNTYYPEYIVREKGFARFANTTMTLNKVVGISDLSVYLDRNDKVEEIAPTTVKKLVAGNGKATKEDVAEEVFRRLQIDNKTEFYTKQGKLIDDRADAVAVSLAYMMQKGMIS